MMFNESRLEEIEIAVELADELPINVRCLCADEWLILLRGEASHV
jgi:hypothetical protein